MKIYKMLRAASLVLTFIFCLGHLHAQSYIVNYTVTGTGCTNWLLNCGASSTYGGTTGTGSRIGGLYFTDGTTYIVTGTKQVVVSCPISLGTSFYVQLFLKQTMNGGNSDPTVYGAGETQVGIPNFPVQLFMAAQGGICPTNCFVNLYWNSKNANLYGDICLTLFRYHAGQAADALTAPTHVLPGNTFSFNLTVPCSQATNYWLGAVDCNLNNDSTNYDVQYGNNWYGTPNPPSNTPTPTNGTGVVASSPSPPPANALTNANGSVTQYTPTPTLGIPQTNILWSSASSTNNTTATREGFSVLHDDLSKGFAQNHSDLYGLSTNLANLSRGGGGTNNINVSLTNNLNFTNNIVITNLPSTNSLSNTNLNQESTQQGVFTNIAAMNEIMHNTNALDGSLTDFTNTDVLKGKAASALSDDTTAMNNMKDDATAMDTGAGPDGTSMDTTIIASAPGGPLIQFHIMPETDSFWVQLYQTVYNLWVFLITIGYAVAVIKVLVEHFKIWSAVPRRSVQNLDAAGFNLAGVALYITMIGIFLGAYAGFCLYATTSLSGSIDWHTVVGGMGGSGNVFSVMDSGAISFLKKVFPLAFAISAVCALIAWRLQMFLFSKVVTAVIALAP